jgi:hypothetical protein
MFQEDPMPECESIRAEICATLAGDPWHGPSLAAILEWIDATTAAACPVPGRHSAWEVTLHITEWTREVARRLRGEAPDLPRGGDWPPIPVPADASAWHDAVADLHLAHQELDLALQGFPAARLDERVGGERDAPLGTGVTWRRMLLGQLQHDAWHGGQIALLTASGRSRRSAELHR